MSGIWRRPYFQGLSVEFPVGVAIRIRAFQHNMATSWSTSSLRVGDKASKAMLVSSNINISKNAVS